jgi:hypothetical protein
MFTTGGSERIASQPGHQHHRVAEPREAERHVRGAAARVGGERSASALADEIDERLADDDEHLASPHNLGRAR